MRICGRKLFCISWQSIKEVYTNPVFGGFESFFDTFKDRIGSFVNQIYDGAKPEEIDTAVKLVLKQARYSRCYQVVGVECTVRLKALQNGRLVLALKVGIVGMGGGKMFMQAAM